MKKTIYLVEVDGENAAADMVLALQDFGFKTAKVLGVAAIREDEKDRPVEGEVL